MAAVARLCRTAIPGAAGRSYAYGYPSVRGYATVASKPHHRIVIVGGGTAGVTVAAQIANSKLEKPDIAIVEPAATHHYQPGWTLVGTGLKPLSDMQKPLSSVIPHGVKHYPLSVSSFDPSNNVVRTAEGVDVTYDYLVVAPGLETNFSGIAGLPEALSDEQAPVSSIYSAQGAEKTWRKIQAARKGRAIFTQPAGIIKCAGAPQKVLWMALSQWARDGVRGDIDATFATGAPSMFAVAKYGEALEALRKERGVEGLFQHNLVAVDSKTKVATFKNLADGGKEMQREFDFLHVVPPQKPWDWVAKSPLADEAGWVAVDKATTQHTKFPNVFSIGDASSLPNSKTAAAITAQAPVLVNNMLAAIEGRPAKAEYNGYASCPLLTGHGELMLCEFKYGGVPEETFAGVLGGQEVPNRLFYHLKKDVFPFVYWNRFIKGTWYGPKGFSAPVYS
ncbi:related to Sulfide:quinone oxidoreductase, mitochondrial precursor [Cephalotrichum gorgonifer]|uniref:Sulfide:quinone oxidoreductase, mitochondrial n=1 Tax=Cephalotrichum gorgonifer TaxID=2041049 RepID=A0AAE8N6M4_9PEZI|nr:related to Sulfide:quinone oxidoreductase, mitochondrial precursor [Cephalotrichum gorgonifer]